MNTKRLIMSVGMLVFVGAAVIGGTGAFFSDTETSTGNVFTAGSVSISLDSLNHTYYGDETAIPQDFFVVSTANNVPFFTFNDLKPGDTGMIEKELTNGANDAFFCAKNTLVSSDPEFLERLKLRVNTGNGLTAEQFYNAPFDEWYTLDAASAGNPGGPGLAVDANATVELDLEYCLGDFVSGTAGTPGDPGASCVVDTTSGIDWNALQNDEIRVDVEYYAVQQRNNGDFSCADLNPVFELTEASEQNGINEAAGDKPYFTYVINGNEITFTLVNPRNFTTFFDYQVDGEAGYDPGFASAIIGSGPLAGEMFGNIYNSTSVPANSTEVITVSGSSEIRIGIHFGPEQDDFLDWATFTAN